MFFHGTKVKINRLSLIYKSVKTTDQQHSENKCMQVFHWPVSQQVCYRITYLDKRRLWQDPQHILSHYLGDEGNLNL